MVETSQDGNSSLESTSTFRKHALHPLGTVKPFYKLRIKRRQPMSERRKHETIQEALINLSSLKAKLEHLPTIDKSLTSRPTDDVSGAYSNQVLLID
jgi:hypothetical protein